MSSEISHLESNPAWEHNLVCTPTSVLGSKEIVMLLQIVMENVIDGVFTCGGWFNPPPPQVCKILSESSKGVRGARVEHNRFCVTIHFRRVKEEVDLSLSLSLSLSVSVW
jgi:hypothetical protein